MKVRKLPGLSICQTHKVAPATAKDYVEVFGEVVAFALSVPNFRWSDSAIVDQMLVGLFDDRLLEAGACRLEQEGVLRDGLLPAGFRVEREEPVPESQCRSGRVEEDLAVALEVADVHRACLRAVFSTC